MFARMSATVLANGFPSTRMKPRALPSRVEALTLVVESHAIGRLDGFQFAADPGAAGPEAKALRAAAQKALAGEINSRAARLQATSDDHIVLDAVRTWRYRPATCNGVPTEAEARIGFSER